VVAGNSTRFTAPAPDASRSCAVVVLFHPDHGLRERLKQIFNQFAKVVLVDNTPGGSPSREWPDAAHVIRNDRNLGVAVALNQGIDFALANNFEWLATFDQDSELLSGYLEKVISVATRSSPCPVLVGCNYLNADRGRAAYAVSSDAVDVMSRPTLITSGTFMPAEFARGIGGFREDYFIDSVDHEFCLRARRYGAAILMTAQPYMRHRMGVAGVGIGRTFSLQHSPLRRYYIVRNTLATVRKNAWRHPLWSLRQLGRLAAEGAAIVAFESGKGPKLRAYLRGLWHGIIGRSGPHPHV